MVQEARKAHYNSFGPYRLGKTIGQGEFGKVKLGYHLQTGKEIAIKLVKKESIAQPCHKQKLAREINILQSIRHPYIVKLWEVLETEAYIGMVLEYASGGELFSYILAKKCLKEPVAQRFFAQLIVGTNYLHKNGIVHRDLKLENLLLDKDRNIIITDFGFANRFSTTSDDLLSTSCGSPCYAAPELVVNDCYVGESADIWSCGVILYAMLSGYLPFDDDPENAEGNNINLLYRYILQTKLRFPSHVSTLAKALVNRILVTDPKLRASADEIMSHKWLESVKNIFNQELKQRDTLSKISCVANSNSKIATKSSLSILTESPLDAENLVNSSSPVDDLKHVPSSVINNPDQSKSNSKNSQILEQQHSTGGKSIDSISTDSEHCLISSTQTYHANLSSNVVERPSKARRSFDGKALAKRDFERSKTRAQSMDSPKIFEPASELDSSFLELKNQKYAMIVKSRIKFHSGLIDQRALSSKSPIELMELVYKVLQEMNLDIFSTPDQFKFKVCKNLCDNSDAGSFVVPHRDNDSQTEKKRRSKFGSALAAFPTAIFERIKYMGIFGLKYNHGFDGSQTPPNHVTESKEPIKLYVMIHQIKNLDGLLVVDLKRARGDMWEFKRLYHDFITRFKEQRDA